MRIRIYHNMLVNEDGSRYSGKGETRASFNKTTYPQKAINTTFTPTCFKCGTSGHLSRLCTSTAQKDCTICTSSTHNDKAHQAMVNAKRIPMGDPPRTNNNVQSQTAQRPLHPQISDAQLLEQAKVQKANKVAKHERKKKKS